MHTHELSDFVVHSEMGKGRLYIEQLTLSEGEFCSIRSDSPDDTHLFLRALASLAYPVSGVYRHRGNTLDFSDYRRLLAFKQHIGYIASDAAMLSNRTIRENLLLMRFYDENSLSLALDENAWALCCQFNIQEKLDFRPADLDPVDLRAAITIRELTKSPELMLIERPEWFVGHRRFDLFTGHLEALTQAGCSVVCFSNDQDFVARFSTRTIIIENGMISAPKPQKTG